MSRTDKQTLERNKTEIYSDFLTNFDVNPVTGFLAKTTNEDSVKQALKNLMLTSIGERFYDNNKGSKIRNSLFEPNSPFDLEIIKIQAREAIAAYEPRATLLDIRLDDNIDVNSYALTFVFSIINIISPIEFTVNIKRVR